MDRDLVPPAHEQVSLLLVDDRPENLVALSAILDSPDYRLILARSGPEALDAVERDDFALVLLDVAMPGMTGFEVADRLKGNERTKHIPILFLTAVATGLDQIYRAYTIGAVDYLVKPLNVGAVRAKVAVFADLYRQRRELERHARTLHETERREHAIVVAELRVASDERYRKLVEGIDHAFAWQSDALGERLSFVSSRAGHILGYPLEDFARPGFLFAHVHPEDQERTRRTFAGAAAEMGDRALTHRILASDGTPIWFHTGVSCTTALDDGHVELHGLSVDVSELKKSEEHQRLLARENARLYEAAEAATQARDELLRVVSHDLRDPLGAVVMYAARLRAGFAAGRDPATLASQTERIERAAETMRRLVDDLIDLERIGTGQLSIHARVHPVAKLLLDAAALVEPLASARSVEIQVEAGPVEGVSVLCDSDRILQVLSNLLGNAIRFSPAHARVVLSAAPAEKGEQVRFAVTDTGPGIAPAQLPHLFDRFGPAKESRSGLGLGLPIARGLVEAHKGRIWAETEIGKGSTFFFTLPEAAPGGREASAGAPAAAT
jgi:PAS domain S-box-containing protein